MDEAILPSEVARLVLGYLEEQHCTIAYNDFLQSCPHLAECRGRGFSTRVSGLTLVAILNDYINLQSYINSFKCEGELKSMLDKRGLLFDKVLLIFERFLNHGGDNNSRNKCLKISVSTMTDPQIFNAHRKVRLRRDSCDSQTSFRTELSHDCYMHSSIKRDSMQTDDIETVNFNNCTDLTENRAKTVESRELDADHSKNSSKMDSIRKSLLKPTKRDESKLMDMDVDFSHALGLVKQCETSTPFNKIPSERKLGKVKTITPRRGLHPAESFTNEALDIETITNTLLLYPELHQKIAENINQLIGSALKITNKTSNDVDVPLKDLSKLNDDYFIIDDVSQQTNEVIKAVVDKTEKDPLFDQLLNDLAATIGDQSGSDSEILSRSGTDTPNTTLNISGDVISPVSPCDIDDAKTSETIKQRLRSYRTPKSESDKTAKNVISQKIYQRRPRGGKKMEVLRENYESNKAEGADSNKDELDDSSPENNRKITVLSNEPVPGNLLQTKRMNIQDGVCSVFNLCGFKTDSVTSKLDNISDDRSSFNNVQILSKFGTIINNSSQVSVGLQTIKHKVICGKAPDIVISRDRCLTLNNAHTVDNKVLIDEVEIMKMPIMMVDAPNQNLGINGEFPINAGLPTIVNIPKEKSTDTLSSFPKIYPKIGLKILPLDTKVVNNEIITVEENEPEVAEEVKIEENLDESKMKTPPGGTVKKLSRSTPSKKYNHVRILDFNTPCNKIEKRRALTAPKATEHGTNITPSTKLIKVTTAKSCLFAPLAEESEGVSDESPPNDAPNQIAEPVPVVINDNNFIFTNKPKTVENRKNMSGSWDANLRQFLGSKDSDETNSKKPSKTEKSDLKKSTSDKLSNSLLMIANDLELSTNTTCEDVPICPVDDNKETDNVADKSPPKLKNKKDPIVKKSRGSKENSRSKGKKRIGNDKVLKVKLPTKALSDNKNKRNEDVKPSVSQAENIPASEHITPEMPREFKANPMSVRCNLGTLMETPFKNNVLDMSIATPKFLTPWKDSDPISTIKILGFPTPNFDFTPIACSTTKSTGKDCSTPESRSSKPTGYSSCSSYYKPDDVEDSEINDKITISKPSLPKIDDSTDRVLRPRNAPKWSLNSPKKRIKNKRLNKSRCDSKKRKVKTVNSSSEDEKSVPIEDSAICDPQMPPTKVAVVTDLEQNRKELEEKRLRMISKLNNDKKQVVKSKTTTKIGTKKYLMGVNKLLKSNSSFKTKPRKSLVKDKICPVEDKPTTEPIEKPVSLLPTSKLHRRKSSTPRKLHVDPVLPEIQTVPIDNSKNVSESKPDQNPVQSVADVKDDHNSVEPNNSAENVVQIDVDQVEPTEPVESEDPLKDADNEFTYVWGSVDLNKDGPNFFTVFSDNSQRRKKSTSNDVDLNNFKMNTNVYITELDDEALRVISASRFHNSFNIPPAIKKKPKKPKKEKSTLKILIDEMSSSTSESLSPIKVIGSKDCGDHSFLDDSNARHVVNDLKLSSDSLSSTTKSERQIESILESEFPDTVCEADDGTASKRRLSGELASFNNKKLKSIDNLVKSFNIEDILTQLHGPQSKD